MKSIYLFNGYTDTIGNEPYWTYPHDVLCPKYGFVPYYISYAGKIDLAIMLDDLSDSVKYPNGSMIVIDLERDGWYPWDAKTGKPLPEVIDRLTTVIKACKIQRPDLSIGFYELVPGRWLQTYAIFEELVKALKPLAEVSDFICPEFYVNGKDFKLDETLWIHRKTVEACKRAYHNKRIIPFMWSQWNDARLAIGQKEHYTDAEVKYANIPTKVWRALLDGLTAGGVNEIVLYGQYNWPWNEEHGWIKETLEWQNKIDVAT